MAILENPEQETLKNVNYVTRDKEIYTMAILKMTTIKMENIKMTVNKRQFCKQNLKTDNSEKET